jgi:hypothetical protein
MCWGLARLAHRSIWGLVSPLFLLAIGLRCRPHRTSMQYRGRRIKHLRGGHGPASSYSVFHLAFHSPQRTCRTLNHPATTRASNLKVGRLVSNSRRSYSLVVRMILTVLTYNVRSNNNQSTRNGGDALWNAMNAPVGNPRPRPINPTLVAQAVGPIPGVVPTTTTRAQPAQQPPQGESA